MIPTLLGLLATASLTSAAKPGPIRWCVAPPNAVYDWTHGLDNSWTKYNCTADRDDYGEWTMLNMYRSGGIQDYHWKYVKNNKTDGCLKDWTYYTRNGSTIIARIKGYTTTLGDKHNKPWCGLPHYEAGGLQGYQWSYCWCWNKSPCFGHPNPCEAEDSEDTPASRQPNAGDMSE